MTKEQLIALGIVAELADKVVAGFGETHVPKAKYSEVETELNQSKGELKDRDKQLEELKKNVGDNEELKKQIATLQKDNADKENVYKTELENFKRDSAIDLALTQNKGRNLTAIKALLKTDAIKFEDGKLTGFSEQLEELKKSSDYLFEPEVKEVPKGLNPATPPTNDGAPMGLEAAIAASLNK